MLCTLGEVLAELFIKLSVGWAAASGLGAPITKGLVKVSSVTVVDRVGVATLRQERDHPIAPPSVPSRRDSIPVDVPGGTRKFRGLAGCLTPNSSVGCGCGYASDRRDGGSLGRSRGAARRLGILEIHLDRKLERDAMRYSAGAVALARDLK